MDIVPDADTEMERNSPLFLLDNILAEYSTPIGIRCSEKNTQALGFMFFELSTKSRSTFDVDIYTNGTYRGPATLVIETAGMNRAYAGRNILNGYLLSGISAFFTSIKDKKLTDLSLGGVRTIPWTTDDPLDGSNGYWQAFQKSYDFTDDYVVLPCKNLAFASDDIQFTFVDGWMNKYDGTKIVTKQQIVPWPKFEYVLTQIFEENGWKLDTTGLNDEVWKKLLLYSNYLVPTCSFFYNAPTDSVLCTSNSSVNIELSKAMPQDKLCSTFIFEFCKRFFWFPLCDQNNKTCRLIALKNTGEKTPKDWTKYSSAVSSSDFSKTEKIFAFKNDIEGDDGYSSSSPDLSNWLIGYADSYNLLPDPANYVYANSLYYTFFENKYWQAVWDETTHTTSWEVYGDNIYDVDPGNATDTIETIVSTLPISNQMFENGFFGFVPIVNQEKQTKWGIRCVLYHGMTRMVNELGQQLDPVYPYGSSTNTPPFGSPQLAWSNVWSHSDYFYDYGIIEYWGARWLNLVKIPEVIKRNFRLPLYELVNFQWDDTILVHNILYLVSSYIDTLKIDAGYVTIQATLQRINLEPYVSKLNPGQTPQTDDVHFTTQQALTSDEVTYHAVQNLHGTAGTTVTIKIIEYVASNPDKFQFKVNENQMFLDNTFDVALDASGNGSYNVSIYSQLNYPAEHGGMRVKVQIISVTAGVIGTPDTAQYSKAI